MATKYVYILKHSSGDMEVYSSLKRALFEVRDMFGITYNNADLGAISNLELELEFSKSNILMFDEYGEVGSVQIVRRVVN